MKRVILLVTVLVALLPISAWAGFTFGLTSSVVTFSVSGQPSASVEPVEANDSGNAGSTLSQLFKVCNTGPYALLVDVTPVLEARGQFTAEQWQVRLSKNKLPLEPKQCDTIKVTSVVPPGDYRDQIKVSIAYTQDY